MHSTTRTVPASNKTLWASRITGAIPVLFLVFDGVGHVLKPAPVVKAFAELGVPDHLSLGLGLITLTCTVLYVMPRASVLGAILLTGYLGGATATQVRAGAELFPILFPVILGVLLWGSLVLRDEHVQALIPLRAR